jgi:hypothetical protein
LYYRAARSLIEMGRLPFPPDAELTGPDRLVLAVLQKQFEAHEEGKNLAFQDAAEESDDSTTQRFEFVAPSPEGNASITHKEGVSNGDLNCYCNKTWTNLLQTCKIRSCKQLRT